MWAGGSRLIQVDAAARLVCSEACESKVNSMGKQPAETDKPPKQAKQAKPAHAGEAQAKPKKPKPAPDAAAEKEKEKAKEENQPNPRRVPRPIYAPQSSQEVLWQVPAQRFPPRPPQDADGSLELR